MMQIIKKIGDGIDRVSLIISGTAVGVASAIVIIQIFLRYFFGNALSWADELSRYCMVYATYIALPCVYRRKTLTGITIFVEKIPLKIRKYIELLALALSIFFLSITIFFGTKQLLSPSVLRQITPALKIPMYIPYFSVPLGATLLLYFILEDVLHIFNRKEGSDTI
ncbi:TRAP transporter small permease [Petroclostridium sp. X23]|uniref:TRAP transporter small permease n=1 Tax=Petroclostridium sp. X23 TaxID=3045146 RepID=UPI0024AE7F7E|nr:TRAP transporter small permease [Petroclostridium sp. X23]WHH59261.1 TRAP transporter small permease [Petroclostridium sp. X23]